MEIERKFLPPVLPEAYAAYRHDELKQGYLNLVPVVRVRREGDKYYLTYKGSGLMAREEHNLPLTKEGFLHLVEKADGTVIEKTRYYLPLNEEMILCAPDRSFDEEYCKAAHEDGRLIELDVFAGPLAPLVMAEIEFPSEEAANAFTAPEWLGEDVTNDPAFHNGTMSRNGLPERFR